MEGENRGDDMLDDECGILLQLLLSSLKSKVYS